MLPRDLADQEKYLEHVMKVNFPSFRNVGGFEAGYLTNINNLTLEVLKSVLFQIDIVEVLKSLKSDSLAIV